MDRFVTVTKKRKPNESDEGESSVASSDNRPATSNQKVAESVEQQKKKNRKVNSDWEENYFVTEHKGKAMCLICRHEFAENKKYNVESHFNKQHHEINEKFLASSEKRSAEISRLKSALQSEQKIVKSFFSTNHLVTRPIRTVNFINS